MDGYVSGMGMMGLAAIRVVGMAAHAYMMLKLAEILFDRMENSRDKSRQRKRGEKSNILCFCMMMACSLCLTYLMVYPNPSPYAIGIQLLIWIAAAYTCRYTGITGDK